MPKFHVTRSIEIDAPCEKVFEVVSDFSTWTTWSPWLIAEPDAQVDVSSDSRSVGSTYAWDGQVTGAGGMTHQVLTSPSRVESEIRFLRPMKSVSQVSFDIEPAGGGTRLYWNMDGSLPWFLFWMTKSMDVWIGMDYERGLRMVKEWIESNTISSKLNIHGIQPIEAVKMAGVRGSAQLAEIGPAMDRMFKEAQQAFDQAGTTIVGAPLAVYHHFDMKNQRMDFTAGFPLAASGAAPASLNLWELPACQAFRVEHTGCYSHLGNAWSVAEQHVRYKKLKKSKAGSFEVYRNSPEDTPPADLITDVYVPLR